MLYRRLLRPALFRLPPETAHEIGLHALTHTPSTLLRQMAGPTLAHAWRMSLRFGLRFTNPLGLAAGFDKNGVAVKGLAALGFSFLEAGTVTNLPQAGNEKPRLFRLPADRALLNRLGFNNHGAAALAARWQGLERPANCVLGVNIGKSRAVDVADAIPDYLASFAKVHAVADYIAVNVSSPNTPNLRELQRPEALSDLLNALRQSNAATGTPKPILVKIAPDLDAIQLAELVSAAVSANVAGFIATNTTISRAHLQTPAAQVTAYGAGGISGAPVRESSTRLLAQLYLLTSGKLPLIGVGGIMSAADAWEKICAGASLLQIYTGFIYQGPTVIGEILTGLAQMMTAEGFTSLDEAVGSRAVEYRP